MERSSLYLILLVSGLVISIAIINLFPWEEEDIEIASYVQEPYLNVAPGGSVNASVYIENDGNTDVDVRLRFNHEYKWDLVVDERVGQYLDRQSEGIIRVLEGSSGDDATRVDFLHTAPGSAKVFHRWLFMVDVIFVDENNEQHVMTHNIIITVGWVLQRGIPEEHQVVTGFVSHIDFNYTNLIIDPLNEPTRFYLDYEMSDDIEYTVTTAESNNITPDDLPLSPPIRTIDLLNREMVNLTIWFYCPSGTELVEGLTTEFLVTTTPNSDPIQIDIVYTDIVLPVHNMTIEPFSSTRSLRFDIGKRKAIHFEIISYSNVQERLAIEYVYDEVNISLLVSTEEEIIEPEDIISLRIVVIAGGEEDYETEFSVIIRFGQDQEYQSQCSMTLVLEQ